MASAENSRLGVLKTQAHVGPQDGRIYLLNNPVLRPKPPLAGQAEQGLGTETLRFRDPLTVALSTDGKNFSRVVSVMSCTNLSATSGCSPRLPGSGKNAGPSYPQGLALGEADVAGTVRTTAALG